MALIKCKKCGEEISSTTDRCIHCGNKIRKSHKTLIIVLASVLAVILIIVGAFVGLTVYVIKEQDKYVGTWTNVVEYYDKGTNKFVCSLELTINIKDDYTLSYKAKTLEGECNYTDLEYFGVYDFDDDEIFGFNQIEANVSIDGRTKDVDILYKDDYICYDNCSTKANYYYKNITKDKYYKEYINYYDTFNNTDNNTSHRENDSYDLGYIREITYNEYTRLIKDDDEQVIIIGSPSCPHCRELVKNINSIISSGEDDVYYLNINKVNDDEYRSILSSLSLEDGVPILTIYDNGLKEKFQGSMEISNLKDLFIKYNIIDRNMA